MFRFIPGACCTFRGFGQTCNDSHLLLERHTEYGKVPLCSPQSRPLSPPPRKPIHLLPVSMIFAFSRTSYSWSSSEWLLSLTDMHSGSLRGFLWLGSSLVFLVQDHIPLSGRTAVYPSVHKLRGIPVTPQLGELCTKQVFVQA